MAMSHLTAVRMPKTQTSPRRLVTEATMLPPGVTPAGSRGVILNEALRLFAERGYGSASIRDIAERVGIKAASMYSHYPSKAHVLAELIKIGHDEHLRRMREAVRSAKNDPVSQLVAVVRAHTLAHAEYAMLAVVSHAELHSLAPEFAAPILAVRRQSEMLLADIIQRGVNLGLFDVPDAQLAMLAIGAMGLRVAHWFSPDQGRTAEQIADNYAQFATRLVGVAS